MLYLVVWGFASGQVVGTVSSHADRAEAMAVSVAREQENDNPACAYWVVVACATCGGHEACHDCR